MKRPLILAIIFFIVWSVAVPVAYACLPVGRFDYTVGERTADADIVIEGTVLDIEMTQTTITATILVEQYLKGDGSTKLVVSGYGFGSGDCLSSVLWGTHAIFFVQGNPYKGYEANYLGVYSATETASKTNLLEASTQSGQSPIYKNHILWDKAHLIWVLYRFHLLGFIIFSGLIAGLWFGLVKPFLSRKSTIDIL